MNAGICFDFKSNGEGMKVNHEVPTNILIQKQWHKALITTGVKLYPRQSLNNITAIFFLQYLNCFEVSTSSKVDSKSLILRLCDSSVPQREVLASDTYSVS